MSATLATRPPKRFHPAGFHAFPFLPCFVGCFYMRYLRKMGSLPTREMGLWFDSTVSHRNAGQLYPQPPDAWDPSPHRQHLLSGFFFSMSHAFFHNSRAGILSAPFLARRMCVNKAPRPQTRGFFNAMWPPERSLERVSAEILLAGSSPRAAFYIPVAQSVERWSPKPKAAGSGPAGNARRCAGKWAQAQRIAEHLAAKVPDAAVHRHGAAYFMPL